jgi:aminoglycoside 6-adenylyltransferase
VTDTASFIEDENWIQIFEEILMLQKPDKMDKEIGLDRDFDRSYIYLMLFTDGNRIDLHIETIEAMADGFINEKLTVPLLDKDNILAPIPSPTDLEYHVKRPSEAMFVSITNNFLWCLQNVAK